MKNNKWIKCRDKRTNKYVEAVRWTGINRLEIHDFIIYLYRKRGMNNVRVETTHCVLNNALTITISDGLIKTRRLEVNSYIVEYDDAPFVIYCESLFKQCFSVDNSFRYQYKKHGSLNKYNECLNTVVGVDNDDTQKSDEKKYMMSLTISDTTLYVSIENVIFNGPATIVTWGDGSKTVVKCQEGDDFDKEKGLAMAISKKVLGNKSNFNNTFKHFIGEEEESSSFCSGATADAIIKRLNSTFKEPKKSTYYNKLGTQNKNFIDIISVAYGYDCETLSKLLIENHFNRSLMLKALIESVK